MGDDGLQVVLGCTVRGWGIIGCLGESLGLLGVLLLRAATEHLE
jgi:hypothetical protein